MSIQDDIFDLAADLEGRPEELELFEKILAWAYGLERLCLSVQQQNNVLREAVDIIRDPAEDLRVIRASAVKKRPRSRRVHYKTASVFPACGIDTIDRLSTTTDPEAVTCQRCRKTTEKRDETRES